MAEAAAAAAATVGADDTAVPAAPPDPLAPPSRAPPLPPPPGADGGPTHSAPLDVPAVLAEPLPAPVTPPQPAGPADVSPGGVPAEPPPTAVEAVPTATPNGQATGPPAEGPPPNAAAAVPVALAPAPPLRAEECGLWVYQRPGAEEWVPVPREQQRLLEAAHRAGDRVVDLRLEQSDWLADLKTSRLLGHAGAAALRRRPPPGAAAAKRQALAEWRARAAAADRTMDEFEERLRTTFSRWREAVERREAETLRHLEVLRGEYGDALDAAHAQLLAALTAAGFELEAEQLPAPPTALLRLTFKGSTDKAFLIRRTDEGFVLKWREPGKAAASPRIGPGAVDRPSPARPAATSPPVVGDFYLVTAAEALHAARHSWAFRFDKGRYLMAGLVKAEAAHHAAVPWKGEAFLWQLNFCTTNGGLLGTVAPGLINHPPVKVGSIVTLTFDPAAGTLASSVGSRKSVVIGTGIRGAVVPAFVVHRGEEVTVLHAAPA